MTKKTKNKKNTLKTNKIDEANSDITEDESIKGKQDNISDKIEALKEELAEANDSKLRALAEVENMRRRMEKEKQENARYGASNLARGLFSVLDNFDRALKASPKDLKNKKDITVTDKRMARFVMSLDEAVNSVLKSINLMKGREIFILKSMKCFKIYDLALALVEHFKISA